LENSGRNMAAKFPRAAARWTLWQPKDRRGADEAAARTAQGGVAKLPYGGLNRIRFEGCVSTGQGQYPRFGGY